LREFFEALAHQGERSAPAVRSPGRRQREISAAQSRLAGMGIA
jgi:hypothetical protein